MLRNLFSRFLFLLMLLMLFITAAMASDQSVHYIMDTDMGYDDWMAVLYLLKQPVQIDGITIDCQGETLCPQGAVNAEKLSHLANRDVPISTGFIVPSTPYAFPNPIRQFATKMQIKGFSSLTPNHDIVSVSAAQFIEHDLISAARTHTKVAIISIGTASNIADAWQLAQKKHQTKLFRQGLKMIYKGGGAFGQARANLSNHFIPGNISIPHLVKSKNTTAEWNIYADAPAMRILVNANLPITFIPNNASNEVPITKIIYKHILKYHNAIAQFNAGAIFSMCAPNGYWDNSIKGLDFWDTLATMTALHPSLVTKKVDHLSIRIRIKSNDYYGTTWVDPSSQHVVTVYDQVNSHLFYKKLLDFLK